MAAFTTIAVAVSAVAAVASVGLSYMGAKKAEKGQERAMRAQKRASETSSAAEKARQLMEQRRAVRESRVRRAKILQASANSGVYGSSGMEGSLGAIGTNLGDVVSNARGRDVAVQGINTANQNAYNAIGRGNIEAGRFNVFAGLATAAGSMGSSIFNTMASSPTNPESNPIPSVLSDGTKLSWS